MMEAIWATLLLLLAGNYGALSLPSDISSAVPTPKLPKKLGIKKFELFNPERDVLFLHIGKTGGSTIKHALHSLMEKTAQSENPFRFYPVHLFSLNKSHTKNLRYPVLVSVRDPIERTISSFNWKKMKCRRKSPYCSLVEKALYHCYPTFNNFAESMFNTDFCGNLTRIELLHGPTGHIGRGLYFYLKNLNWEETKCSLFSIDTKTLLPDMLAYLDLIGRPELKNDATELLRLHINSDYPEKRDKYVSANGTIALERLLRDEYEMYRYLTNRSDPVDRGCPG